MFDLWRWPDAALLPSIMGLFFLSEAVAALNMSTLRHDATSPIGNGLPLPIVGFILLLPGCLTFVRPITAGLRSLLADVQRRALMRFSSRKYHSAPPTPHHLTTLGKGNSLVNTLWSEIVVSRASIALGGLTAAIVLLYLQALQHLTPTGLMPLLCLVPLWHRVDSFEASSTGSRMHPFSISKGRFITAFLSVLVMLCFGLVAFNDSTSDAFDRIAGVFFALSAIGGSHLLEKLVSRQNATVGSGEELAAGETASILPASQQKNGGYRKSGIRRAVSFDTLSGHGAGWMLVAAVLVVLFRGFVLEVERNVVNEIDPSLLAAVVDQSLILSGRIDSHNANIPFDYKNNNSNTNRMSNRRAGPLVHKFDGTALHLSFHAVLFAVIAVGLLGPVSALFAKAAVTMFGASTHSENSRLHRTQTPPSSKTLILVLSPSGRCLAIGLICAICTWWNVLCPLSLFDSRVLTALGGLAVVTAFSTLPTRPRGVSAYAEYSSGAEDESTVTGALEGGKGSAGESLRKRIVSTLISPFIISSFIFLSSRDLRELATFANGGLGGGFDATKKRQRGGTAGEKNYSEEAASHAAGEGVLTAILRDPKQRRLCIFLCLTLSFMFVELIAGLRYNSLGLVSDSFHMLLDSSSIAIGLWSAHIASWPRNKTYPLGYGLFQLLSGFTNGVLLIFIALYVLCEAAERMLDPPDVEAKHLFGVSLVGLLINVVGVVFFHDSHHGGGHGHSHGAGGSCPMAEKTANKESTCGHSHGKSSSSADHNMRGVYLHILADLFGSIAVMFSSLVITYTGWNWVDPFCSGVLSIIILVSAGPLLSSTTSLLLQQTPLCIADGREYFFFLLEGGKLRGIEGDSRVCQSSGCGGGTSCVSGFTAIKMGSGTDECKNAGSASCGACPSHSAAASPHRPSIESNPTRFFDEGEILEVSHLSGWSLATSPRDVNVLSIRVTVSRSKVVSVRRQQQQQQQGIEGRDEGDCRYCEESVRARVLKAAYESIATPRDIIGIEIIAH